MVVGETAVEVVVVEEAEVMIAEMQVVVEEAMVEEVMQEVVEAAHIVDPIETLHQVVKVKEVTSAIIATNQDILQETVQTNR